MEMILPILCGVFILMGLIAVVMSRETWPIYQMILVAFVLLANAAFLYLAARTLFTHREWRNEVKKYETAYAQQYGVYRRLTGELDGSGEVEVDRQQKAVADWSLDDWKAEAAKVFYGRGRVLLGVVPNAVDPMTGTIRGTVNQLDPVAFPKDSTVHVFEMHSIRDRRQPARYLGQYLVSNVAEKSIELTPVNPEQKTNVAAPLAVYEVAPIDSHEAFNDEHVVRNLRAQMGPVNEQESFAAMREAVLRSLFPPSVPPEVVREYLKDGMPAEPNDPPERVWRLVQFKQEYASDQPDASPSAPVAEPAAEPAVDEAGAAEEPVAVRIRKFQPGDTALLDPQTAKQLVDEKRVAEYVTSKPDEGIYSHVYVRPLHDYPTAFRDIRSRLMAANLKRSELDRQLAAIQKSIQLANQTVQLRQQQATELTSDLEKFSGETAIIQKHHDALDERVKELQAQIEMLKQSIQTRAGELTRLQLQAAAAVDSTPAAAVP